MKKILIVMLLPFVLPGVVCAYGYYQDLDMIITNELKAAQKVMNTNTKLSLKIILHALVLFGKKTTQNRILAIESIVRIQKALQVCKAEQYNPSWYDVCAFFNSKPEIVRRLIDPALAEVDKALASLKVDHVELGEALKKAGVVAIGVALVSAYIALVASLEIEQDKREQEDIKAKYYNRHLSYNHFANINHEDTDVDIDQAHLIKLDKEIDQVSKDLLKFQQEGNQAAVFRAKAFISALENERKYLAELLSDDEQVSA